MKFLAQVTKFFRADLSEVIGAYFDGDKIFIVRLTENFETIEIDADSSELEHIAKKISLTCQQHGWKISAVGFCLQESDAVTYQTTVENIPDKEIPAFVKSWAITQSGIDALFSFDNVGKEIWLETLPRATVDEFCTTFKNFGMNLRGLSVMPTNLLTKNNPFDNAKFIAEIVRNGKSPNLLSSRDSMWNWEKFSPAIAAVFLIVMLISSAKLFIDYRIASNELDAIKISLQERHEDLDLKKNLDADIAELNRLNKLCAEQGITTAKFNLLVNLGKVAGGGVHLTKIRADENFLELEGISVTPDAVKSYLSRVKSSVIQNARLENSSENKNGDITFTIRATLK